MTRVQLVVDDEGNREVLASLLAERYTTVLEETLTDADLFLVDDASLPAYREALLAHKRDHEPVFCPVVLVRRDRTPVTIELPDPTDTEPPLLVDEVMDAPVGGADLHRRISNLLTRREQTLTLKEQNERLERFASMLRHELRNPLQILRGHLDVATETLDSETAQRCETALDRMERLLEDATVVITDESVDLARGRVSLAGVVSDCWEMTTGSRATLRIDGDLPTIRADEDRLKQLLENLFRNAIDHATDPVTVTVGATADGFYVADDGPGIDADRREDVFDVGETSAASGTGLGLAVVEAVAGEHGWSVRVVDSERGGARFEVSDVEAVPDEPPGDERATADR